MASSLAIAFPAWSLTNSEVSSWSKNEIYEFGKKNRTLRRERMRLVLWKTDIQSVFLFQYGISIRTQQLDTKQL